MVELSLHCRENEVFLVSSKGKKTYEELARQTSQMYRIIKKHIHGEEKDIVLVQIQERFQMASVSLALGKMGVDFLLVNSQWATDEINTLQTHTMSRLVITDNQKLTELKEWGIEVVYLPEIEISEYEETHEMEIQLSGKVLMCTTGTTGEPKIVARTWDAIFYEVDAVVKRLKYTQNDRIFCLAQWTHSLGFIVNFLSGLSVGARLIVMSELNTPANWVRTIAREGVTVVIGVPTFYSFLVQALKGKEKLRMGLTAGAALPKDVYQEFCKKTKVPLLQFYGCTEAGAITMQSPENEIPYPSVGRPLDNIQVRIVDEEKRLVKQGEIGSICIKGPGLAQEILKNGIYIPLEEEYITGDQGMFAEDGSLIVLGRNQNRVKVNGLGLHLGEVEKVLQNYPDILEALVKAEYDLRKGNILVAYIKTGDRRPNEMEIRKFCVKHLAAYKIPRRFEFVEDFERDSKGQIIRNEEGGIGNND